MSERPEFFHTRIEDGRVPIFVFENSLFFPNESIRVTYRFKSLDRIAPGKEAWREYLKPKGLLICVCKANGKAGNAKTFDLPDPWGYDAYKVGTAAVISNIEETKEKGNVLVTAECVGKAEVWGLADPAGLRVTPEFPLAEKFGVFDSQLKDKNDLASALKMFNAMLERFMKLDTLSTAKRAEVVDYLNEVPDQRLALATDPESLVKMLHSIMYLVGESFLRPLTTASALQKMLGQPHVEEELAAFNLLLGNALVAHLDQRDPSKGKTGKGKTATDPADDADDDDNGTDDNKVRRALFNKLKDKMNPKARKAIARALKRVEKKSQTQDLEEVKYGAWLDMALHLPWDMVTQDRQDLKEAREILDAEHYGMEDVKEKILDFLAQRMSNPIAKLPILCFVGPPGTGKTSLGRSIARATNRKYCRLAVGGVRDEASIRGHSFTYVGSKSGLVMRAVFDSGSRNPVCVIDEIDKLKETYGDPSAVMMEVLDPEQNTEFEDHYLGFPFDLSQVLFICTANKLETIPGPLQDRMFIVKIPGYFEHEKVLIAQQHLARRAEDNVGLSAKGLKLGLSDDVVRDLIVRFTFEPGVRDVGRNIEEIARKINRGIIDGRIDLNALTGGVVPVASGDLEKYLGEPKVRIRRAYETIAGEAFGLSIMEHEGAVLGDILPIHARLVPGHHAKEASFTGRLGDSMKESAKIALSCAKIYLNELGRKDLIEELSNSLIHISTADGAQPKDGPSAGLALFSTILSAVLKRPLRPFVAMTGELQLTYRVTEVGGIKGKVLAAERARIPEVLLPKENERDFDKLPQVAKDKIKVHLVSTAHEALPILFGVDFPPKTAS